MPFARSLSEPSLTARMVSGAAAAALVAVCSLGIRSTNTAIAQSWDEPTHLAAGLEWLQDGTYKLQTENPPLGRLGVALGAHLAGARLPAPAERRSGPLLIGKQVLYDGGHLDEYLAGARAGVLPTFWVSAALVWLWLARFNSTAAFLAVAFFATLPPILGHSGQATTDIAFVAAFLALLLTLRHWLETPSRSWSVGLGVALGIALATKFTTIPLFAAAVVGFGYAAWRQFGRDATAAFVVARVRRAAVVALPTVLLVLWAVYGFSVGRLSDYPEKAGPGGAWVSHGPDATGMGGWVARQIGDAPIPAPALVHGLLFLSGHNRAGHRTYALGQFSQTGFWYAYPLGLAVRTPIPFLLFIAGAAVLGLRRAGSFPWWHTGVVATTLLGLAVMTQSRVNIGLRHVFVLYPLLAIAAATATAHSWRGHERPLWRWSAVLVVSVLLGWQGITAWRSHPQWLTYFNALAGDDPGYVLSSSDLDWGQGAHDLERFASEHHISELTIQFNGSARLCAYELPPLKRLEPRTPPSGWVAISETAFRQAAALHRAGGEVRLPRPFDFCDRAGDTPALQTLDRAAHEWLVSATPAGFAGPTIRMYRFSAGDE